MIRQGVNSMTGTELKAVRNKLGVKQAELCRSAGIRRSLLSAIEKEMIVLETLSCHDLAVMCLNIAEQTLSAVAEEFGGQQPTAQ
jgi:DNA-binding XRE family transcriptional regulator